MKTINSFRSKLFALALTASVASFAYEFEYVNDFHIDGFGYKIISVNTPDDGEGYVSLIEIADCKKDVVIPKYVSYGDRGFHVTTFGMGSVIFTNDASSVVESITIPKTTSVINKNALAGCPNLKTVVVDSENPYYDSRENCNAIITTSQNPYFTPNTLIAGCQTPVIPHSVAEIADKAFYNSALESITIPTGVTKIGRSAFNNSNQLSSVTLPASLKEIGDWAFADCLSLNTIICYALVPPTVSSYTFQGSNPIYNNPTVYVPAESVEAYKNAEHWKWFLQILPIEKNPKDLFPTLWGLQRTSFTEYFDSGHQPESEPHLLKAGDTKWIGGNLYLDFGQYLREENGKIYIYSELLQKDFVLYDFTLELGDTLTTLNWDYNNPNSDGTISVVDYAVDCPIDTLIVTDISTITLLDGKEYKKWIFNHGYFGYVESIGTLSGLFYELSQSCMVVPGCYMGDHLVCASRNGQLLYQMDDAEMEQLETECLCEIEPKWSETWCNQWNILSHGYLGPQDPLAGARTSIYWLSNNTVNRNGQEYIPLMCSSSLPNEESTLHVGELRFTEDKQVYFYYDNTEYLLYDFDVQVGDTLDIFGGIELYSYSFVEQKTYPHVITKIDTLDDGRLQITSDAIVIFEDGEVGTFEEKQQQIWIEGLGSINGIVHTGINPGIAGNSAIVMLCAYRDDECVYKTDSNDPYWIDYTQLGCVYNEGDFIEDAFPILSGLQRTVCNEYCGETEEDNSANFTYKQTFDSIFFENDKPYILCNGYLLREEDNKIFLYSQSLNKDIVLYDFTLEVGDSLPTYIKDFDGTMYSDDTLVVTDISSVTLLDGKEYKKWTFDNGMEYVEGIGMYGGRRNGNFFGLIQEIVVPCHTGTHLVCVSKNGKLLYQMDDAEMERLGAECLCDYDRGPRKDNAKNGKIGGRPTPTQWNMLEVETKEMDGTPTILRAETFSYTLENDSLVANNKTFYQLARQSTKDTAITKSFVGALHFGEDEDNRVYFLRDGHEYVLYDFTAEPGDTVEIFAGINNYPQETTYTHVVTGKDTLENGACRMMLEVVFPEEIGSDLEQQHLQKVWLAGLGSIDGIVHNAAKRTSDVHAAPAKSASSETQSSVMLCAWREDSCLYTTNHPEYDTFGCVYNQDPTAVENLTSPSSYQKIIHEGTLLILHEGKVYNVIGIQIK